MGCADADHNEDGVVGTGDLLIILEEWGGSGADSNGDGTTNIQDLTTFLIYYGIQCTE